MKGATQLAMDLSFWGGAVGGCFFSCAVAWAERSGLAVRASVSVVSISKGLLMEFLINTTWSQAESFLRFWKFALDASSMLQREK